LLLISDFDLFTLVNAQPVDGVKVIPNIIPGKVAIFSVNVSKYIWQSMV